MVAVSLIEGLRGEGGGGGKKSGCWKISISKDCEKITFPPYMGAGAVACGYSVPRPNSLICTAQ